jgi:hypothetical protein
VISSVPFNCGGFVIVTVCGTTVQELMSVIVIPQGAAHNPVAV